MNNQEILNQLKQLLSIKELSEGFKTQQDCIDWSNNVAPLLKFNEEHYQAFKDRCSIINTIGLPGQLQGSALNQMISIAKQAFLELEYNLHSSSSDVTPLSLPQKITLSWLWHNVPYSFWLKLASIIVSAFLFGVFVGQSKFYQDLVARRDNSSNRSNMDTQEAAPTEKTKDMGNALIENVTVPK